MLNVDDLLLNSRFNVDDRPHITVNRDLCAGCAAHACVRSCPAGCYKMSGREELEFSCASCLECGTCRIVCDRGAVAWNYPRGGYGICYCLA